MGKFSIGFIAGFALIVLLNIASLFLFSIPEDHKVGLPANRKVGLPRLFWVEDPHYASRLGNPRQRVRPAESEFYWGGFLIDLAAALGAGFGVGQWYQRRGEPPVEQSSTPTPS